MSSQYSLYFDDFSENLTKVNLLNSFDSMLQLLFGYANLAVRSGEWKGRALYLPQLDETLINLLKHNEIQDFLVNSNDFNNESVIIATEVYNSGGHGKVLNQILGHDKSHVIFTDLFNNITNGQLNINELVNKNNLSCTVLIGSTFESKLKSLINLIKSIKPKRRGSL